MTKDIQTTASGTEPEGPTLESLREVRRLFKSKRFVYSALAPEGVVIGMMESKGITGLARVASGTEEPDYYLCREETANEIEYLSHCKRLGVEP